MDTSAMMKEQMIRDYVAKVNFGGKFSVKEIKQDLRRILKEEPAVQLDWKKEEILSEVVGETKKVESVKSITVAFSDGTDMNGNPKVHKVIYYI